MPCKTTMDTSDTFDATFRDWEDEEAGFYNPGKDLFQKFQLDVADNQQHNELLTPPCSPVHDQFDSPISMDDSRYSRTNGAVKYGRKDATYKNSDACISNLLDFDATRTMVNLFPDLADLKSNLIQDCMWSAPGLTAIGDMSHHKFKFQVPGGESSEKTSSSAMDINSQVCVDPAAVFPYPVSKEHNRSLSGLPAVPETPSPSESDDDGDLDDDDEEDEEEIDVVTVMPPRKRHCPGMSTFSQHVAAMHNYSSPQSPPISLSLSAPQSPSDNLNTSLLTGHKGRPMSMPASPQPVAKRQRSLIKEADLHRVVQKLNMRHPHHHQYSKHHISRSSSSHSSRHSSDSEESDGTKRAQHNVLERKRRNDLKYSFLRLRDNVPDIQKQERTPKVVILKQSSKFVYQLRRKNNELVREYERQKARNEQLLQRLCSLRKHSL